MIHRSSEVVSKIEKEVLSGKLNPGERLPSEEKLCEQFGVSRTVIREAIQQLRGRGMLRTLKGSGSYIADPSLNSLSSALETYSVLTKEDSFLQLIDFRILVETECARLAAQHAGQRDLEEISQLMDDMKKSVGNREQFSQEDIAFHSTIAKASRNNIYLTVLCGLEKRCIEYAYTNRGDEDWYGSVIATHKDVYDAIAAGKADEAASAMRQHLLLSRRHYIDIGGEQLLDS